MEIQILYEDENVVAVNKPAGLMVHGDGKTDEKTLVDFLLEKYPEIEGVGEPPITVHTTRYTPRAIPRWGIVHRLDKETSGAMVVAKTAEAHAHFKKQFQDRLAKKTYHAFLHGEMKKDEGVIDRPIGRSSSDFRKWSATRGAKGEMREALTEYKVLKRGHGCTFVEVRPKTGRTHQIRVHFKAINYPVVCDKLYAFARRSRDEGGSKQGCVLGFDRLALHSLNLGVLLPSGKDILIEAPYPEDFRKAISLINP
ncbi:MAG: RluA family pseudouridine synthase [bacterium]|nr:RluA family pseudouridine synthase [bacterium]